MTINCNHIWTTQDEQGQSFCVVCGERKLEYETVAGWARNWHWNDTALDQPVDPSIYFRDMRMLKAFIAKFGAALQSEKTP